jgi:hypothetical protein
VSSGRASAAGATAGGPAHAAGGVHSGERLDASRGWPLFALLAVVAALYLITLRAGQPWHDDFALYVLHARNLIEGIPYDETRFVYNPADPWYSPRVYPPGFPLLLAPIYAIFGADLFALRIVVIASAVAAVAAFALLARPILPAPLVLPAAALLGFQPFLVRFKNLLLPDFTFLLFVLLSLHLIRRLQEDPLAGAQTRRALLAGGLLYAALAVRTPGIAIFGAIALYYLLRLKLPGRPIMICMATAAALYATQLLLMPRASGYLAQLEDIRTVHAPAAADPEANAAAAAPPVTVPAAAPPPAAALRPDPETAAPAPAAAVPDAVEPPPRPAPPAVQFRTAVRRLFAPAQLARRFRDLVLMTDVLWTSEGDLRAPPLSGFTRAAVGVLMLLSGIAAVVGYAARLRRPTVLETFVPAYGGILVVWTFPSARYLIPLLPFLLLYGALGLALIARSGRPGRAFAGAVAVLVALSYAVNLPRITRSPYEDGVTGPAATALFEHIRTCVADDARLLAFRPRALTLYTGREATSLSLPILRDEHRFQRVLEDMRVTHVTATRNSLLDSTVAARPGFERRFGNQRHVLYAATPAAAVPSGCAD